MVFNMVSEGICKENVNECIKLFGYLKCWLLFSCYDIIVSCFVKYIELVFEGGKGYEVFNEEYIVGFYNLYELVDCILEGKVG